MDTCSDHNLDILRYLDNQLAGDDLAIFLSHLRSCYNCRTRLESERALSRLLLASRPLYLAPLALRARVSTVLSHPPGRSRTCQWFHTRLLPAVRRSWRTLSHMSAR
jgi:anti-sigma factor RsiW